MKLTEEMRLFLYNQYEILKIIDSDESERYNLLQTIVSEGYEYNYNELGDYSTIINDEKSKFVFDVLSMIDALQSSYKKLKKEDRDLIDKDQLTFKGFDGNEEIEEYQYARFVIKDFGRYEGLEIDDYNSHCNMINTYIDMLKKWGNYNKKHSNLTLEQIQDVIQIY